MPQYVVSLRDVPKFIDYKLTSEVEEAASRGLLSTAMKMVQIIKVRIIPSRVPQPVNRGTFRAQWKFGKTPDGGAEFFNNSAQAAFIEGGVRAENVKIGTKMINALAEWATMKGIVGKADSVKATRRSVSAIRRQEKRMGRDPGSFGQAAVEEAMNAAAQGIAWAIAKSMQKKGIFNNPGPGMGILREAVEKYLPEVLREEVEREIGKVFK